MRDEAHSLLPPQFLDCLEHIDQPFFPRSTISARRVWRSDAWHWWATRVRHRVRRSASPSPRREQRRRTWRKHLPINDDIDRALAAYNAARRPLSERIASHSRTLGTQLGVGIETEEDRRLAKVVQTPNGNLDWIVVRNFLAMRP